MGRDLNRFHDMWALPVQERSRPPQSLMTLIPFDAPREKEQEYLKFIGMDLNRFQYIWALPVHERNTP